MAKEILTQILSYARWAPSGDNTQPWRFEILSDTSILVRGHDTRDHILYDFEGHASHLAHGALLETIRIAASGFGLACTVDIRSDVQDRHPVYEVAFAKDPSIVRSPLIDCIERRTVQRRPMNTARLSAEQWDALGLACGIDHEMVVFEGWQSRLAVARLLWKSARIRLICKEAYSVHKEVIEWRTRFSKDKIPESAVGVDPLTARLMQWAMKDWRRVAFLNTFLGGTIPPRIQLDFLPGLLCSAHVLIRPRRTPDSLEHWLELGAVWQRIWLTATLHGLHCQPEMTPIIFRWYARSGKSFSDQAELFDQAVHLADELERLVSVGPEVPLGVMFRIGSCSVPRSRSIRLDLDQLIESPRVL